MRPAAQNLSRHLAADLAILINDFAVDDGVMDAFGALDQALRAAWIVLRPPGVQACTVMGSTIVTSKLKAFIAISPALSV